MLRIDAHHHVWDQAVRPQDWMTDELRAVIAGPYDFEDWRQAALPAGVHYGVFVQTVAQPEETPEILAASVHEQTLAGVVGWIDVDGGDDPGALLDELLRGPGGDALVGVRVAAEYHPDAHWLAGPAVAATAAALAQRDLSLDLLMNMGSLPAAVRAAEANPATRMVLDHLSKPTMDPADFQAWAHHIRALGRHEHVACKFSGFQTFDDEPMTAARLRPYVDTALEAFGPDRLMFGSDWPVCLLGGDYTAGVEIAEQVLHDLSRHEREQVWSGTARRWYPAIESVVGTAS